MYNEDGRLVEVDEVREAIQRADLLVVGFRSFQERLLIDSRTAGPTGPMVRVVEPLGGVDERMHWLGKNRPQFGMPQRFTFFVWPHSIGYLQESGVAETLYDSVRVDDGVVQLDAAFSELRRLERDGQRAAVRGDDTWKTLWRAPGGAVSR